MSIANNIDTLKELSEAIDDPKFNMNDPVAVRMVLSVLVNTQLRVATNLREFMTTTKTRLDG